MRVYIKSNEHKIPIAFAIPTRILLSKPCIKAACKALDKGQKTSAVSSGECIDEAVEHDRASASVDAGKLARELRKLKRKNGWIVDIEVESADGEVVKLKI